MISISRLLLNKPIPVAKGIQFHQTKVEGVLAMGEEMYWGLLKLWCLKREDMIPVEDAITKTKTDFEIWCILAQSVPDFQVKVIASVHCFLHTKIEFLPMSNTIMIGETDSLTLLDEAFYLAMREICESVSELGTESKKEEQYQVTDNMSEREKQLVAKMKQREAQLAKMKDENGEGVEDRLIKQVIGLVAIGRYTFEEVYNMTIIQIVYLLRKYVDIQQYELYTTLSPYMDSKKSQGVKHWLDT
jgi:hypothetical protein